MASEEEVLNYAIEQSKNVLLIGKHGVGKTAMVQEAFNRHGLKWKYFSASTIDPWVDLVGVPKEKVDEHGNSFLELVRPKDIEFDDIEAIFLDEYNRSPKKVRNAVMELIQFGSINGKKLGKLRIVFAAINPDDDEDMNYDVDKLDPAQLDRFELHLPMAYKPSKEYFKKKFGGVGVCAVKWWNDQTAETKDLVSPRRLEYAVDVYNTKGDVRHVLPGKAVNVKSFLDFLDQGDPTEVLDDLCERTPEEVRKFFADHNSLNHVKEELLSKVTYVTKLSHLLPEEELMSRLKPKKTGNKLITHIANNPELFEHLRKPVLQSPHAFNGTIVSVFQETASSAAKVQRNNKKGNATVTVGGANLELGKMNICFTGTLDGYSRDQATKIVKDHGAMVSTSMGFGVTHAVIGNNAGAKAAQARKKEIACLTEADFDSIVQQLSNPTMDFIQTININGQSFDATELTLDNYKDKTGQLFRMTKEQTRRLYDSGKHSRDEARQLAFEEFIDGLVHIQ